jgi:uncharacterized protein
MFPPLRWFVLPGTPVHDPVPRCLITWICGVPCLDVKPTGHSNVKNTVVYLHGNKMDIYSSWRLATEMANATHTRVIVPEYRGYGMRGGTPDPEGTVVDIGRVLMGLSASHVVGFSVGAALAAQVCVNNPHVKSITLISPFYSLERMATRIVGKVFASMMLHHNPIFNTSKWLPLAKAPIFILHGSMDRLIPMSDGHELSKLANTTFMTDEGAGHENINYEHVYEWLRVRIC